MKAIQYTLIRFIASFWKFVLKFNWEKIFLIILIIISPFLVFYHLDINPRSWHDEGAILSVPKTLVEDGVYATSNFGGYQTFGPIQSAGPTVILPVAFMFKVFGIGLFQARIVAGIYALIALFFFFSCGKELFGKRAALIASFFLLSSPSAGFLLFGRHVLGDIPALAFFLGGAWRWIKGAKGSQYRDFVLSGCFFGAAIITKTQYLVMIGATLFILLTLDFIYYRQKLFKPIFVVGTISLLCFIIWTTWQIYYFGMDTYKANAEMFSKLAKVTTGFSIGTTREAIQFIFGSGSGFLYGFWGFFSEIYIFYLCQKRKKKGVALVPLFTIQLLWIGYFTFWTIPWRPYFIVPGTIIAMFVGALANQIIKGIVEEWKFTKITSDENRTILFWGSLISVGALLGFVAYQFQTILRLDVLDNVGVYTPEFRKPPEFSDPLDASKYLKENVSKEAVIDTWERELGILNENTFHYPDQSMLIYTHAAVYHGAPVNYSLGKEYFDEGKADYVIVGWWARLTYVYDLDYLENNSEYVTTIGSKEWGYDIYKLKH